MAPRQFTEEDLDFYLRFPEQLSTEDREALEGFIRTNTFAAEYVDRQRQFYAEFDREMQNPLAEGDLAFADKLSGKKQTYLPGTGLRKAERGEIANPPFEILDERTAPLPVRLAWFLWNHPVPSFSILGAIAAAVVLSVHLLTTEDANPAYAKVADFVLSAYNAEGKQLWTHPMLGHKNESSVDDSPWEQTMVVSDIDGDGHNEVIVPNGVDREEDTLKCFNSDGTLRWKRDVGRPILFGARHSSLDAMKHFNALIVLQDDGARPRLIASAVSAYLPSKVCEIDPVTGKDLQSYWTPGGVCALAAVDVDNDGKKELLIGGTNDAWNRASLAILDPSRMNGHAPVQGDYAPENCPPAKEKFYLLFPFSQYGQVLSPSLPMNRLVSIRPLNNGAFTAVVNEVYEMSASPEFSGSIHYNISPVMNISLVFDNPFITGHQRLERQGRLKDKVGTRYAQKLIDSILFWNGEKFVEHKTLVQQVPRTSE